MGAVLLVVSYLLGTVNRWRRGGLREALFAQFGVAGLLVFVGGLVAVAGVYESLPAVTVQASTTARLSYCSWSPSLKTCLLRHRPRYPSSEPFNGFPFY